MTASSGTIPRSTNSASRRRRTLGSGVGIASLIRLCSSQTRQKLEVVADIVDYGENMRVTDKRPTESLVKRIVPLLAFALLVSACQIRIDVGVVVNEDETGTLTLVVALDEELREFSAQSGSDEFDIGEIPDGWTAQDYSDGEFEGTQVSTMFTSLEDLRIQIESLAEETSADGDETLDFLSQITLTKEGSTFTFSADLSGLSDNLGTATEGAGADDFGIDSAALLADLFAIRVILTLPGEIVSHNADTVSENTLTWNLSIADEGRVIEARSKVGGDIGPVIGIVVLILVLAVIAYMVSQRRKEADSHGAPAR